MRKNFKQSIVIAMLAALMLCGCAPATENTVPDNPPIIPDVEQKVDAAITPSDTDADTAPDTDTATESNTDVITDTNTVPDTSVPDTDTPVTDPPVPDKPPIVLLPEKEIDSPFRVVVDAGHGGSDPGAIIGDVYEAHINLSIAMKLADILEQNGVEVIRTRTTDKWVSLPDRHSLANEQNADLCISLHCNIYGADPDVSGLECYYRAEAPLGRAFAQRVLDAAKATGEIRTRSIRVEDYQMLIYPKMPSVLVEMGFMTNPHELQKLSSDAYQQILAEALAEAVLKTLNS